MRRANPCFTDDGYRISDELWAEILPMLAPPREHPWGYHNPSVAHRAAMDAILLVLRTGCHWNSLNVSGICTSSSAHRWFQEWRKAGVFEALWKKGVEAYDELKGLDWSWLAMDGAMTKAPLAGTKIRVRIRRIAPKRAPSEVC